MLCNARDVAEVWGREFTDSEEEEMVDSLIAHLQGELELYCNRPLGSRTVVDELVTVTAGRAFFGRTPVQTVTEVRYADTLTEVPSTYYEVRTGGVDFFSPNPLPYDVRVDYVAGLPTTDWRYQGARSVLLSRVLRVAAKAKDDALGVSSLTQEGYSAAYLAEGWTDQELKLADRLRVRTVVG